MRRLSDKIKVGNIFIGGDSPVSVQSMTNKRAHDFAATLSQVKALQDAGCDIVRIAVPDTDAAPVFSYLKKNGITLPLVADIHFDYRIALEALRQGADKIRINPGNIGEAWKVEEVARACKSEGVPIRIGVNSGSLDKKLLKKYGSPTAKALAESALGQAEMLLKYSFSQTVISIKSSDVKTMCEANRIVAENSRYPIHLGVTEAGTEYAGIVKNAVGIGTMLTEGIGDTVRVSLTADPVREVVAAKEILKAVGLYDSGINIISCPTFGRTRIDLIGIAEKFREASENIDTHGKKLTVAVMGCAVNGPGEAREADFGIAGGDGYVVLFKNGENLGKFPEENAVDVLLAETENYLKKD